MINPTRIIALLPLEMTKYRHSVIRLPEVISIAQPISNKQFAAFLHLAQRNWHTECR